MENRIVECVVNSGDKENSVDTFMDNLVEIFAHTKGDITEFCKALEWDTLTAIRNKLFEKLDGIIAKQDYELFKRRKKCKLVEDMYIMGFSVVSKAEHKMLCKVLRDKTSEDASMIHDEDLNVSVNGEDQELLTMCLSLREQISDLVGTVSTLNKRVDSLESELTMLKIRDLEKQGGLPKNETNVLDSFTSVTEISSLSGSPGKLKSPEKSVHGKKLRVRAEVHHDKDGIVQPPQMNMLGLIEENIIEDSAAGDVFRHSRANRKNILKRPKPKKIRPASETKTRELQTKLVYCGKLSFDTEVESIRAHLLDIGVNNDDIADIMKLRCRTENETSFCVSLNSSEAEKIVINSDNWPAGIRVRTYNRVSVHKKNSNSKSSYYRQPPRFQKRYHSGNVTHCLYGSDFQHRDYNKHDMVNGDVMYPDPFVSRSVPRMYSEQSWVTETNPKITHLRSMGTSGSVSRNRVCYRDYPSQVYCYNHGFGHRQRRL